MSKVKAYLDEDGVWIGRSDRLKWTYQADRFSELCGLIKEQHRLSGINSQITLYIGNGNRTRTLTLNGREYKFGDRTFKSLDVAARQIANSGQKAIYKINV